MHRIHLAFDVSLNLDADGTDQTVEVRAVAKLDGLANHIGLKRWRKPNPLLPRAVASME